MIKSTNDINTMSDDGKLVISLLARLTCNMDSDKTPDEVIALVNNQERKK